MRKIRTDDIYVSLQALTDFAWSAPMRDLAKKVGRFAMGSNQSSSQIPHNGNSSLPLPSATG